MQNSMSNGLQGGGAPDNGYPDRSLTGPSPLCANPGIAPRWSNEAWKFGALVGGWAIAVGMAMRAGVGVAFGAAMDARRSRRSER